MHVKIQYYRPGNFYWIKLLICEFPTVNKWKIIFNRVKPLFKSHFPRKGRKKFIIKSLGIVSFYLIPNKNQIFHVQVFL